VRKGRDNLRDLNTDGKNINTDIKKICSADFKIYLRTVGSCGGFCKLGNKLSGSIQVGEVLD
jgi:hypothetical protein